MDCNIILYKTQSKLQIMYIKSQIYIQHYKNIINYALNIKRLIKFAKSIENNSHVLKNKESIFLINKI